MTPISDVFLPLALCLLTLSGLPFSHFFLRTGMEPRQRFMLAPTCGLIAWSLLVALACTTGSLAYARPWFWGIVFVLTVGGIWIAWSQYRPARWDLLILAALISLATMAPYIIYGIGDYPGTWFWDGWHYLAQADVLWNGNGHSLGQFGVPFINARQITPGLIALTHGILPIGGNTQSAVGFVLFLYIFALASASVTLALTLNLPRPEIFSGIVTFSGLIVTMLHAHNYDQLLAVSIIPALMAVASACNFKKA